MEIVLAAGLLVVIALLAYQLFSKKPAAPEAGAASAETARALGKVDGLEQQVYGQRLELETLRTEHGALLAERSKLVEREQQAQATATESRARAEVAEKKSAEAAERHQASLAQLQIAHKEIEHHKAHCAEKTEELEKQVALYKLLNEAHNEKCTEYAHIKGEFESLHKQLAERQDDIVKTREQLHEQFKNSMNELMEVKARSLKEDSKNSVAEMLTPVKDQLSEFAKRVDTMNIESSKQHGSLTEKLAKVEELNAALSQEAHNLAQALRGDAKVMGDWGEVTLERVLQAAGLAEQMYSKQDVMQPTEGDEGVLRSDFLIHLPDKRHIVIDSKVSLKSYVEYTAAENEVTREQAAKNLLRSLEAHIAKLAESAYHDRLESPEFTFMFVPHDPIFNLAVRLDQNLVSKAYQRKVLMVTPSTLVVALKVVTELWQRDTAAKSQQDIIHLAGNIYNKLHDGLLNLERVGKNLETAQSSYKAAMTQLVEGRGNAMKSAEEIKKIGGRKVKVTKSLAESFPRLHADAMEELDPEPTLTEDLAGEALREDTGN